MRKEQVMRHEAKILSAEQFSIDGSPIQTDVGSPTSMEVHSSSHGPNPGPAMARGYTEFVLGNIVGGRG